MLTSPIARAMRPCGLRNSSAAFHTRYTRRACGTIHYASTGSSNSRGGLNMCTHPQRQSSSSAPDREKYDNPLVGRYSSPQMSFNWSPQKKFSTWRKLWWALATAQKELGLPISQHQVDQMEASMGVVDFEEAERQEKILRHDVMSHVHAFGKQCPSAMPIIHLGATSCYVGDNTDLIQIRDGLKLIQGQLLKLMDSLRAEALKYADLPTLGFTHYQPAQLTTVGKRMSLWLQDLLIDHHHLVEQIERLPFRGVKGTTGTQASFLQLLDGDHGAVAALDERVSNLMGFRKSIGVSGQTYTRKLDYYALVPLSGIAQSLNKMCVDVRLLMNLKEVDEPFEAKQIGSSAMAYKRNPMRCERICSLARHVMVSVDNTAHTHANQWFERTLDDSANRRLVLPEVFLATDVILSTANNVISGIKVWPQVIRKRIESELPFMATENILMECVKAGGDRQHLHEVIRKHSMEAGAVVKGEGKDNDLIQRIKADPNFESVKDSIDDMMDPNLFVGRAPEQTREFIAEEVDPVLEEHSWYRTLSAGDVSV